MEQYSVITVKQSVDTCGNLNGSQWHYANKKPISKKYGLFHLYSIFSKQIVMMENKSVVARS